MCLLSDSSYREPGLVTGQTHGPQGRTHRWLPAWDSHSSYSGDLRALPTEGQPLHCRTHWLLTRLFSLGLNGEIFPYL